MYYKVKQYLYNNNIEITEVLRDFELKDNSNNKGPFISKWNIKGAKKPTKALLNSLTIIEDYMEKREKDYPSVKAQLDMIYQDKIDGTDKWVKRITSIKEKYPKPGGNSPGKGNVDKEVG